MTYTIKITDDQNIQAQSLLMFLKSLSETKEYSFLKIENEDETDLSKNQVNELEIRYNHFLKHKESYKDWDDIKHKYLEK